MDVSAKILKHMYYERDAFYKYLEAYKECKDEDFKQVLRQIMNDELNHFDLLRSRLFNFGSTELERAVKETNECERDNMYRSLEKLNM